MIELRKWALVPLAFVIALGVSACGDDVAEETIPLSDDEPQQDLTEVTQAYYEEHSDFFVFATPEEIPTDLIWENGQHLPDIGSPDAKKGGTWNTSLQDFPRTLRMVGPDSNGSFRPMIEGYVRMSMLQPHPFTDEFLLYPGVVMEWAVSNEDKTVYARIDPEARWSDGEIVDVDDVFFTWFFYQSKHIVAPWYNDFYTNTFTKMVKYDDRTFSITFPQARPDMAYRALSNMSLYPKHYFKDFGEDFVDRYQWEFVPSTGPYIIRPEDIKKGRSITMTRIDNWWAKDRKFWRNRFNFDKVRFTVIRDVEKSFEAFKRGELDVAALNLSEYWYEKLPNDNPDVAAGYLHKSQFYNIRPRPSYGLWMNRSKHLLDNRDVRVGLNYATNWDFVIQTFFRGDYTRMRTSSDGFGSFTHPTIKARAYSIEDAQAAFARAGFKERGPDGILVNEAGERLSFSLSTGYQTMKDVLTILKEEAAKAGVEYRIEVLDGTSGWKKVQEKKHDLFLSAFATFYEMYPRYWESNHSINAYDVPYLEDGSVNPERKVKTQTNNLQIIAIPELDVLIDQYRGNDDQEEMKRLAFEMEEIMYEDASFIPGWVQPFYRTGHWRWLRFPEGFNEKHSRSYVQHFVHWIDEDLKKETLEARKNDMTFEPEINTYDQFKQE